MDSIGPSGTLTMVFDTSVLSDGAFTVSVTLTNGAGNSTATVVNVTKDTLAPPLTVTVPQYANNQNQANFPVYLTGEKLDALTYTLAQGSKSISGSSKVTGDSTWSGTVNLSSFANGPVTLTIVETDAAGNPTTRVMTVTRLVLTVVAPTVALSQGSDSGTSQTDYITNVTTPSFPTTSAAGTTVTVYVNGVPYVPGTVLAPGSYSVTATATDVYGNVSATATAPKTLVIATAAPGGSFGVSGSKTINGQLSTNSKTPTLTLSFTDSIGLATMSVSTDGGVSWSAPRAYASSAGVSLASGDGVYTIEVQITDVAGNTGIYTQTVRLDIGGPTISTSLSPPQSATIGYDGTANIITSYGATDISTVGSVSAKLDGAAFTGTTINIYALMAGTHTLVVTAVDGLGNTSSVTTTFQIHPSLAGIEDAVIAGYAAGMMTSKEETTLLGYLSNTANSIKTDLKNFMNAVNGASTKVLTAAEGTLLTSWAQDLYNRS
jgi:hypothetical protein